MRCALLTCVGRRVRGRLRGLRCTLLAAASACTNAADAYTTSDSFHKKKLFRGPGMLQPRREGMQCLPASCESPGKGCESLYASSSLLLKPASLLPMLSPPLQTVRVSGRVSTAIVQFEIITSAVARTGEGL